MPEGQVLQLTQVNASIHAAAYKSLMASRILRLAALCLALASAACTTPRLDVPRPHSEAWPHPEETTLGRSFGEQLRTSGGESGFHLLVSGLEAFSIRAALAESAERTLDLQYYILSEDTTTQLLLYRVLRAAERGVRVRLLIDDLYAVGRDFDLATFSAHPNIEVRVFNPFLSRGSFGVSQLLEFLGDPARLNRRMHNKLWIADNAAAIAGGRNLGDEYFDAHGELYFSDLDVLAAGPVVQGISRSFDDYWNSEWAMPIEAFLRTPPGPERLAEFERAWEARLESFRDTDYARALRETGLGLALRSGQLPLTPASAEAVYDRPPKSSGQGGNESPGAIYARLRTLVEGARQEVILISPYFIPSEQGIEVLGALAKRGVRVRVLTNSLASTDYVPLAHAGYARWRKRLLAASLELYEMRPERPEAVRRRSPGAPSGAYLHTKAIVIDRQHVVVGSMNLDPRSRALNTEVALFAHGADLGGRLGALFDEAVRPALAFRVATAKTGDDKAQLVWITEEGSKEVRYDREPGGFWRRLFAALLGAFAPEGLL
ncbi:MAG: phospholipase D family protein [Betaproteobacteria bacterium]|nr:MAG: phospholipase D family protein [Betaproteobacteria bacterium]